MSVSFLKNSQILEVLRVKTQQERSLTLEVIELLEEVDRRKLHLEMGYGSLMQFCIKELQFSESSAYRRISAMRVTRELPEVKSALADGSLNLVSVTDAQTFFNQEKKYNQKQYSKGEKLELFKSLQHRSKRECEIVLIEKSPDLPKCERIRTISSREMQVTVTLNQELMSKLEILKNAYSHVNPNPTYSELIDLMATDALKKRALLRTKVLEAQSICELTPVQSVESKRQSEKTKGMENKRTSFGGESMRQRSRAIPSAIKRQIWARDKAQCSYINSDASLKCDSKFQLEIDHILPYSLGGGNAADNLRLLCRKHNQLRAKDFS